MTAICSTNDGFFSWFSFTSINFFFILFLFLFGNYPSIRYHFYPIFPIFLLFFFVVLSSFSFPRIFFSFIIVPGAGFAICHSMIFLFYLFMLLFHHLVLLLSYSVLSLLLLFLFLYIYSLCMYICIYGHYVWILNESYFFLLSLFFFLLFNDQWYSKNCICLCQSWWIRLELNL